MLALGRLWSRQVNPPGVTKAAAWRAGAPTTATGTRGVGLRRVYLTILPMLRWAGRSFAVANADPEVLAVASGRAPGQ